MKVLVVHSELGVLRGGGENFTRNLFSAFADRGHNVQAAFLADHKSRYPIPLPSNIAPIPIPGWWSRNAGQDFFSFIRGHLPRKDHFRTAWDRLQEAVSWRILRWHERRFQRRVERDFARQFCACPDRRGPIWPRCYAQSMPCAPTETRSTISAAFLAITLLNFPSGLIQIVSAPRAPRSGQISGGMKETEWSGTLGD